jgi:hypothetical protein
MASKFKPVTLELVDEGRFKKDIDEEIQKATKALIAFKNKYGTEKAAKATAKVSITLTFQFEGRDDSDFSIKGEIKQTVPSKPACVTVAMENETEGGENALFVRASGSTADSPRQAVLATKDGAVVDINTGEVKK